MDCGLCFAIVPADVLPLPFGRQAERRLLPMSHQRLCLRMFCGYPRLVIRGGGRSLFRSRTFLGRVSFFPWPFVSRPCFTPVFFCCCVFAFLLLCFFRLTSLSLPFCFLLSTLSLLLYYCSAVLLLLFCFLLSTSLLHCIGFFCWFFAGLRRG